MAQQKYGMLVMNVVTICHWNTLNFFGPCVCLYARTPYKCTLSHTVFEVELCTKQQRRKWKLLLVFLLDQASWPQGAHIGIQLSLRALSYTSTPAAHKSPLCVKESTKMLLTDNKETMWSQKGMLAQGLKGYNRQQQKKNIY